MLTVVFCFSGRYKADERLADITNLSGPLLSRFDIILTLRDTRDPNWDAVLCEHVLETHQNHDVPNKAQVSQNSASPKSVCCILLIMRLLYQDRVSLGHRVQESAFVKCQQWLQVKIALSNLAAC
jgi:DNA replicative helicase MCM subunit Mcm2 (Cdc46/Mcm family)